MGKRVSQESKEEFAALLKAWRARKGLTQKEAAETLGQTLNTLQNWEIARTSPAGGLRGILETKLRKS